MTVDSESSRGDALACLRRAFAAAGLPEAGLDARLLLQGALDVGAAALLAHPEVPVGTDGARRLAEMARRRLDREPVARILGTREFWGLPFRLSPETLVPRPESETVVAAALLGCPAGRPRLRILDLGTGSGCLLLALLSERPEAWGLGLDLSVGALRTARANAAALGLAPRAIFAASRWAEAISARFDLVVSNPPYIPAEEVDGLDPEVARHDPRRALDGGPDGLAAYRDVVIALPGLLDAGGLAVLELGVGQADAVAAFAEAALLRVVGLADDLGGRARALSLRAGPG